MTRKEVIENKAPLYFDVHRSVSKRHGIRKKLDLDWTPDCWTSTYQSQNKSIANFYRQERNFVLNLLIYI